MNFTSFRSYPVTGTNATGPGTLGAENPAFTFSLVTKTAFSINVTNLDPRKLDLNLSSRSQLWVIGPAAGAIKGAVYNMAIREGNNIRMMSATDFVILRYNVTTTVYFGPNAPGTKALNPGIVAVNLVLTGKIGNVDYGQNLPFISLIATV